MNTKLLGLLAATLATAACSQEKKTETAETTVPTGDNTQVTTTTTTTVDTTAYRTSADALAARVAQDLKVTDPAVLTRIKNEYYARGRALQGYTAKYVADTTGEYAATKAANDRTSQNLKTALTPDQYKTYAGSQGTYYAGPYTATAEAAHKPSLGARVGQGSGIKKLENTDDNHKVKYENGAKIKRSDDGSLKIKRADGTKVKIDEDGHRTVKKGLL